MAELQYPISSISSEDYFVQDQALCSVFAYLLITTCTFGRQGADGASKLRLNQQISESMFSVWTRCA